MDPDNHPGRPLQARDPRPAPGAPSAPGRARLVPSRGPGGPAGGPHAGHFRIAVRVLAVAAVALVSVVFFIGLDPGGPFETVGPETAVRAAVAGEPRRVCLDGEQPCVWLTIVDGELLALSTSGPLREERGRLGVRWCPSSGYFGSDNSGSRFDPAGLVAAGPAPRGLDRYRIVVSDSTVRVDFAAARTGRPAHITDDVRPPAGPDCERIPVAPDVDLSLDGG